MTQYAKYITQEGKNEVLKIAFSGNEAGNTFRYLALGTNGGNLASQTGNKADFNELDASGSYQRVGVENEGENTVSFDENGSAIISFVVTEDNYSDTDAVEINEIALCNSSQGDIRDIEQCTVFAFCEVPPIKKTGNISLKYTLKISIE